MQFSFARQAWQILLFVNCWLDKSWSHDMAVSNLQIDRKTSIDWRSFCSEVALAWYTNQEAIGGDGVIVEIDESVLVRRKYEKGRHVAGPIWIFGGIERESKRCFIIALVDDDQNRSAACLVPIIKQYVKPGSIIVSDKWKAYCNLTEEGFIHWSVNHSVEFVSSDNSQIHTQNIERLWRDVKEWCRRPGIRKALIRQYLARYLFIRAHPVNRLHFFLRQAAKLYPPPFPAPF